MQHYQLYIDGQWCEGSDGQRMQTINPANGQAWADFACASATDIDRAVAAARSALDGEWGALTPTARGKLIHRLAELIEQHAQALGDVETTDSGKLLSETRMQTGYVADYYRYYAGLADKIEGAVLPIDKPEMQVFTRPKPIGVVVAVVPWNAQMFLSATKLGPALAAGCTVILKASEVAPCTMFEFAKLVEQAGFPKGVVQVVTGDAPNCAIPLTSHPDVDRIAFTGGPETAKHVVRNSAENFAVTTLELGGKSPVLVFEDANLDSAVNGLIAGNFGASGQSCVAGSRGLVQRSIYNDVVERIKARMADMVVGDPHAASTHIGPLCTTAQVDKAQATIEAARAQGAEVFQLEQALPSAHYLPPTLVTAEAHTVKTLEVEMFAPVMTLIPFEDEAEAIALANSTVYGLGSGIFTENLARAHRVSNRLRSGICWINTYRAISPISPFGGFNQSGYGREAGQKAIEDYIRTQSVWINTSEQPMANPFVMR